MAEGQKISEMNEVTSLLDACCFPVLSEGNNRRITKANLFNTLVKPTTDALNESVETLNESVETVQGNVETLNETVSGLSETVNNLLNVIYPVGSIYLSVDNNINPATIFGGTWEKIPDRFLVGAGNAYNVGDTGGDIIKVANVNHSTAPSGGDKIYSSDFRYISSVAIDVRPPYLAVNMWKRTA